MIQGIIRRRAFINSLKEEYVINAVDNPKIMAAMYEKSFAKSPDGMTAKECANIKVNEGTTSNFDFQNYNFSGESFDGLKYFTGLTWIPNSAFFYCYLTGVTLPETVTKIGSNAFRWSRFPSNYRFVVPASVTFIDVRSTTYQSKAGSTLIDFVFKGTTPPSVSRTSLSYVRNIYVPDEAVDTYKAAWGNITFDDTTGTALDKIKPMSELPK